MNPFDVSFILHQASKAHVTVWYEESCAFFANVVVLSQDRVLDRRNFDRMNMLEHLTHGAVFILDPIL